MTHTRARRASIFLATIGLAAACVIPAEIATASTPQLPSDDATTEVAAAPAVADDAVLTGALKGASDEQVLDYIDSDSPTNVTINADTNEITAVSTGPTIETRGVTNPCKSGQLCWYGASTPYATLGFSPAGTYTGTWGGRGRIKANGWSGQAWYVRTLTPDILLTSGKFGPSANINIVGSGITGKKMSIHK